VTLRVHSIRAGRDKPGLRPQHLTGLQLIATLSGTRRRHAGHRTLAFSVVRPLTAHPPARAGGALQGGAVGSSDVTLAPRRLVAGAHTADTGTAGSCVLLAQSALPCMLFASPDAAARRASRLELLGGTDAAMAPPNDYLRCVLLPLLREQLALPELDVTLTRRGFFPKGGGVVSLSAVALPPGGTLRALRLERRGAICGVRGTAFAAGNVPMHVAERIAAAALGALTAAGVPARMIAIEAVHEPPARARGDGAGITLVAETDTGCLLGASTLGERGVSSEEVGTRAGAALAAALASGACVDEHAADQLVIFMALAAGESRMLAPEPLSLHARTAIAVAQQLTAARFEVLPPGAPCGGGGSGAEEGSGDAARVVPPGTCLVVCQGAGVTPRTLLEGSAGA
jgi:RNA 3'-terminal phosphate cyclase (ATP)